MYSGMPLGEKLYAEFDFLRVVRLHPARRANVPGIKARQLNPDDLADRHQGFGIGCFAQR